MKKRLAMEIAILCARLGLLMGDWARALAKYAEDDND